MADAVTTIVTNNGAKNYQARFTNISDGTGESAVIKIDKSTLVNEMGLSLQSSTLPASNGRFKDSVL